MRPVKCWLGHDSNEEWTTTLSDRLSYKVTITEHPCLRCGAKNRKVYVEELV